MKQVLDFLNGLSLNLLRALALGALVLAMLVLALALFADETSFVWRYWNRYTSSLERRLRAQFIWTRGRNVALVQLGAIIALATASTIIAIPYVYIWLILLIIGPSMWIDRTHRQRVEKIEQQLDGFVLALANALKTTPSIGSALASTIPILSEPTREEVELTVKEMKVGSTLDQALLQMSARIGSRQVDSALSAVLIGRQVGGNLSRVLDQTANTLREMARLEGVVRTKTAEGKMQVIVLAVLPFALVTGLNFTWPGYFNALTNSIVGYFIAAACGIMWLVAIFLARKILNVDF